MKSTRIGFWASVAFLVPAVANADAMRVSAPGDVRLQGYVGERMEKCIRANVIDKDVKYITDPFKARSETHWWRTEFWGKWMHAAQPFCVYTGCPLLKEKIARGAKAVAATQEADGYIGDYRPEYRNKRDWDIWGHKYTILGFVYAYRATGDKASLDAARKLADNVMSVFGPGKRNLNESGHYHGLPSCSILEAFVYLYRETKDRKYLDYAGWIVKQLDDEKAPASPKLIARKDVLPSARDDMPGDFSHNLKSSRKAYEFMSCYQGMLEYGDETGDKRLLEAADRAARLVAEHEINICGGAACDEMWYEGTEKQDGDYPRLQETCVTTTWLRFCEKLLAETGDPFYADQIEKTFFNAFLGALSRDGSWFASYTPLQGTRSRGQYHCNMHENCCNANGPRGFLAYMDSYLTSRGDDVFLNQFSSARAKAPLAQGGEAELEVFSLYPWNGSVAAILRTDRPRKFAINVRVPGWAKKCEASVKGILGTKELLTGMNPGTYFRIEREWLPGDRLEFSFDTTPEPHFLHHNVAFTAGPLVLARDTRFGDGDISEAMRTPVPGKNVTPVRTRPFSPDMWTTWAIGLPMGLHSENPESGTGDVVRFCDYASAGNTWTPSAAYRVWLPVEDHR